ncbi:MAG: NAD-dependent malic enzyme [Thermodesulfobacteriota bacterium]
MSKKRVDPAQMPQGFDLLRDPLLNKSTAFTEREREQLGLLGLLPPRVHTQEEQLQRVLENLRRKQSDLEKYIFLVSLQDRNEYLFTRLVMENLRETLPIIYTPTVGKACQEFGHIFRRPKGIFISSKDRGRIRELLDNWPQQDVRVIVVTDGERILGLGDLGADGMGIPIGKLSLYTACAGIAPWHCLPVCIDVGTNSEQRLKDPLYIGMQHHRLRGEEYQEIMEEFVTAVQDKFPQALIQFEDFGNKNAFWLLERYQKRARCFNDDIQGTAAVAVAGLQASMRLLQSSLQEQRFLFMGAGEAGTGIGELLVTALQEEGLSEQEARQRCWFVDSKGLVVASRQDLDEHKRAFAHQAGHVQDLASAVSKLQPTALIGVCGQPRVFTTEILKEMARINERPIVFALSNPTERSECTAQQAYEHTEGRAVFASGSPFDAVSCQGKTYIPGQGNNVYIFPGVGLAITACRIRLVTDEMFTAAARALSRQVTDELLRLGCIYPPISDIRNISLQIAEEVAGVAYQQGLAEEPRPEDLRAVIQEQMFDPRYEVYV